MCFVCRILLHFILVTNADQQTAHRLTNGHSPTLLCDTLAQIPHIQVKSMQNYNKYTTNENSILVRLQMQRVKQRLKQNVRIKNKDSKQKITEPPETKRKQSNKDNKSGKIQSRICLQPLQ